jgi:hypothetical protein
MYSVVIHTVDGAGGSRYVICVIWIMGGMRVELSWWWSAAASVTHRVTANLASCSVFPVRPSSSCNIILQKPLPCQLEEKSQEPRWSVAVATRSPTRKTLFLMLL